MKYYAVGELDFTDQNWVAAYVSNVTKMVEQYGGRYHRARPGSTNSKVTENRHSSS